MVGVILFALGTAFFITSFSVNTLTDEILSTDAINSSSNETIEAFQSTKTTTSRLDYILFAFMIGSVLSLMITSYFINGEPIFVFIFFLVIIFAVILSAPLSNTWESITSEGIFGTTIDDFPITNHIMQQLPIYVAIISFIAVVIFFISPRR